MSLKGLPGASIPRQQQSAPRHHVSAPTAGLAERIFARRSRRSRSRPAVGGAGRQGKEAGGRSQRGGGGRGVGDPGVPEVPVAGNLGGPREAPGG